MAGTITSANAIITLQVASVFPAPVQIQGFAADDIFTTGPLASTEVSMGVDGKLSGGFVFVATEFGISLQADSESNDFFDQWNAANLTALDTFIAQGLVILPAIGKKFQMVKGFLTTYPPIPDGGKTLKPRKFGITWERSIPSFI